MAGVYKEVLECVFGRRAGDGRVALQIGVGRSVWEEAKGSDLGVRRVRGPSRQQSPCMGAAEARRTQETRGGQL